MQSLWIRKFSKLAAMVAIAALATSSAARADIIATVQEDSGPISGPTTLAVGSPSSPGGVVFTNPSATFGDFSFTVISISETQTASLSEVLNSVLQVVNNGSVPHTLHVTLEASNFTSPHAPPPVTLLESIGGTTPVTGAGTGNAINFQSRADTLTPAPLLAPDITGTGVAYSQSGNQLIPSGLSGTYSVFQILNITLNPHANLQFTARTDLIPGVVPEPSTMALAALGALGLIGYGLRRRKAMGA